MAISIVGLLVASLFAFTAPVAAQSNTTTATSTATADQCQGEPLMDRSSIAVPNPTITEEEGASLVANFRPDPTLPEDCTIVVDLAFSFPNNGFQFGGGASWEQSTADLVVTQFEVQPGEIRDIRAQIYTNGAEPGDQVTVLADYELWYKGDRENSNQQTVREIIDVEAVNTPAQTASGGDSASQNTADQTQAATEAGGDSDGPLGTISENLGAVGLLMVFALGLVSTVGLIYREPIINLITGGN